jgi:dihydropteroate synthase
MMEWHLRDRIVNIGPRPLVMGVVNVTPDSFSDGNRHGSAEAAVLHGLKLVEEGADLLDVGGESTRPGAAPVALEEELARVVPVVAGLSARTTVPVSVDTSKAEVARQCLEAGARVVNDITALAGDSDMPEIVRRFGAGAVLMHMLGTPATMQTAPHYEDVVADVARFLGERLQAAMAAGVAAEQIVLDPGIGFGKTVRHNLTLLARLEEFQKVGRPVCLGVSRKGFIGRILGRPVDQRLAGSLACLCFALGRGSVQVVRIHDVQATRDALDMFAAIGQSL